MGIFCVLVMKVGKVFPNMKDSRQPSLHLMGSLTKSSASIDQGWLTYLWKKDHYRYVMN